MYEKFYNLTGDPFRLVPDYRFSFGHTSYANAKAYLEYALYRGEGFITVTGPAGTGKTTLIHQVLAELDPSSIQVATLTGTQLEAQDLLHMVAASFDLPIRENTSKSDLLLSLGEFLQRQSAHGQRAIVVVDEAQDLPDEAVEELRLLSNLQANYQLLLQVFLVGQEKLRDLILKPEMDHLRQRIIAASHLEPLDLDDTVSYIEHRLRKVRWQGDPQISGSALDLIYKCSGGVPRRINLICSRLFLYSSLDNKHQLILEDARKVIADLRQELLVDCEDRQGQDDEEREDALSEEDLNKKYSIPREPLDTPAEPLQEMPPPQVLDPAAEKTVRRPVKKKTAARRKAPASGRRHRNASPGKNRTVAQTEAETGTYPESIIAPARPAFRPSIKPGDEKGRKRVWALAGVFLLVGVLAVLAATGGFDRYGDAVSSLGETLSDGYDQVATRLEDGIAASQKPQQTAPATVVGQESAVEEQHGDLLTGRRLNEGSDSSEEMLASAETESIAIVEPIVTADDATAVAADEGPPAGEQAEVFLIDRNEQQAGEAPAEAGTVEGDASSEVAEDEADEADTEVKPPEPEAPAVVAEKEPEAQPRDAEAVIAPPAAVADKPVADETKVVAARKADPARAAAIRERQQRLRLDAQQRLERKLTRPAATPTPVVPRKATVPPVVPPVLADVKPSVPKTRAAIPVSTGPKSDEFKLTLLERQWSSRGKPAVLLPSEATNCKENGRIINCWSLPRNIDTKYGLAVYKVEATIKDFSTGGDFRLAYRTLVMIVGDEEEAEAVRQKHAAPDSGKWQITDHLMSCKMSARADSVRCEDDKGVVRVYQSSSVTSLNAANQTIYP